jgi:hypothetical protein
MFRDILVKNIEYWESEKSEDKTQTTVAEVALAIYKTVLKQYDIWEGDNT